MKIERFEDLECWKHARILTGLVYDFCETKPLGRDGRLRDQVTGAAISVMNNIAEGFGSQSNSEFKSFLGYARRAVSEVQSSFYVALDRNVVSSGGFHSSSEQFE